MKIRLVAFDLDGTLLDDEKRLPRENLEALTEAARQGVICVPATGRIVGAIPPVVRQLPFVRYFIVTNGAAIYDAEEDRLLLRADVPLELALDCCRYMAGLPIVYDCYQNERGWMNPEGPGRAGAEAADVLPARSDGRASPAAGAPSGPLSGSDRHQLRVQQHRDQQHPRR